MTPLSSARVIVISLSLGLTVAFIVFFLIAPIRGYPLRVNEAQELMNIVIPTFSGYLATAAALIFRRPDDAAVDLSPLTTFMLISTAVVFVTLNVVLFWVFYFASKLQAPYTPMDYPTLKTVFLTILSIMTAVYALAIAYLFNAGKANA